VKWSWKTKLWFALTIVFGLLLIVSLMYRPNG
jgi:uncharacterized protein (DUF983 family)